MAIAGFLPIVRYRTGCQWEFSVTSQTGRNQARNRPRQKQMITHCLQGQIRVNNRSNNTTYFARTELELKKKRTKNKGDKCKVFRHIKELRAY